MSRSRLGLVVLAILLAAPARAQIAGTPVEISGQAGLMSPDARAHVKTGPAFGGSLGVRFQSWFVLEGYALFAPSKADTSPGQNDNFATYGLDLRWNFRPGENRVVPYVVTGFGLGKDHTGGHAPEQLERGAPSLGLGALFNLFDQRTYLRLQARDVMFRERDAKEFSNHFAVTLGLHYIWRGKVRDSDLDRVRDWLDRCPGTPIGAKVDARGCPSDSDRDSVFDGLDQCPGTPAGCKVDRNGCPVDSDGDGVCDGLDTCPDTPKGATVDAGGCTHDSDGDGVVDGLDQCEGTRRGCEIDERGCPKDSDGDGVCDGLDKCAGTPRGLKVDENGCPTESGRLELQLFDTGRIRLTSFGFAPGRDEFLPESQGALTAAGEVLERLPDLRVEIGVHSDPSGKEPKLRKLTEARAKAVKSELAKRFLDIKPERFTTKGYGSSQPIVPNTSESNRARNRRVEFTVLNRDVLLRLLRERSQAPAPAPAPPDTLQPAPAPPDTTR